VDTQLAEALLALAGAYLGVGVVFALAFVTLGVGRLDPSAATGSPGFRALIFPGAAALWPLLARRWLAARHGIAEQRDARADDARRTGART